MVKRFVEKQSDNFLCWAPANAAMKMNRKMLQYVHGNLNNVAKKAFDIQTY